MRYEIIIPGHGTLMHACAILLSKYTTYNGDDGSALIFVCWIYGTDIALAVHKQRVRFHMCVCVCVIAFEGVINWLISPKSFIFMRYFAVQNHYNGNDGSAFAESMEQRVSYWT